MVHIRVSHVDFMLFVSILFALGTQRERFFSWNMGFKPIFHCDAKPFALGTGVGLDPQHHTFVSPNAKDTNMLLSFALGDANFFVSPNAKPKRESVKYRLHWVQ